MDELVSGAVLVALVLFSFLSLMSLVDFLRAEWQEPGGRPLRDAAHPAPRDENNNNNNNPAHANMEHHPPDGAAVDAAIFDDWVQMQQQKQQTLLQPALDAPESQQSSPLNDDEDDGDDLLLATTVGPTTTRETTSNTENEDSFNDVDSMRPAYEEDQDENGEVVEVVPEPVRNVAEEVHEAPVVEDVDDEEEEDDDDDDDDDDELARDDDEEDEVAHELQRFLHPVDNLNIMDRLPPPENNENDNDNNNANDQPNNNNNNDGLEDDPVLDADLNIALDELLGVRGPLWIVVRNLLWLLAFNTLYLAIFAFVPRVIGSMAVSLWLPSTTGSAPTAEVLDPAITSNLTTLATNVTANESSVLAMANMTEAETLEEAFQLVEPNLTFATNATSRLLENVTLMDDENNHTTNINTSAATVIVNYTIMGIFTAIEQESARLRTTFRLNDFLLVTIGYACAAASIILMRYVWMVVLFKPNPPNANNNEAGNNNADDLRDALFRVVNQEDDGMEPPPQAEGIHNPHHPLHNQMDEDGHVAIGVAVETVLDAAASIVKVGVLLFLKMFLLPVMLGFCLDWSTISFFQRTLDDIILYAGRDLFSFLFLHWVAGISFMLLVTVSVLQLREVVHPNVLAHIIRPQEPQPDLLGNLLHDSLVTHGKRLFLSLIIYVLLLVLQIHIPVHMVVSFMGGPSSFWKLKFYYLLTPRLQVPLELCIFHLCMLAFLEKNKNSIGELQHYWLKTVGQLMDFSNSFIPHEVEKFHFLGSRLVFTDDPSSGREVDPFWYELASESSTKVRERMIEAKLESSSHNFVNAGDVDRFTTGETNVNGRRIIKSRSDFIRLPAKQESESVFLATNVGRYRLNRQPTMESEKKDTCDWKVELWEEVPGMAIPRPPEGWDDLGVGGADVQGRWAWDHEKKSFIEEGVARRTKLFPRRTSMFRQCIVVSKLALLIVFSWVAATIATAILLLVPLAVGRLTYALLKLSDDYVHDPCCFALGSSVVFPVLRRLMALLKADNGVATRLGRWIQSARAPPLSKGILVAMTGCLWFFFIPLLIGVLCDMLFFWSDDRFVGQWFAHVNVLASLAFGSVVLYGWSAGCISGVLTRDFWMAIFVNEGNNNNNRAAEGPRDMSDWQGAHGRVARFWEMWNVIVQGWEWDQVDVSVLYKDCIWPILRLLLVIFVVPGIVCIAPAGWFVENQAYPISLLVKSSAAALFGMHLGMSCEGQILNWFNAVHQTARDDRYLIGQLLMNYEDTDFAE